MMRVCLAIMPASAHAHPKAESLLYVFKMLYVDDALIRPMIARHYSPLCAVLNGAPASRAFLLTTGCAYMGVGVIRGGNSSFIV